MQINKITNNSAWHTKVNMNKTNNKKGIYMNVKNKNIQKKYQIPCVRMIKVLRVEDFLDRVPLEKNRFFDYN